MDLRGEAAVSSREVAEAAEVLDSRLVVEPASTSSTHVEKVNDEEEADRGNQDKEDSLVVDIHRDSSHLEEIHPEESRPEEEEDRHHTSSSLRPVELPAWTGGSDAERSSCREEQ
jgi:hypothetical protein